MNALVRRAIARGKSRQTIRRLLMQEAQDYLIERPPEKSAMTASPHPPDRLPADRSLAFRLKMAGWRPYYAPSVRALIQDLACYEGQCCASCWEPALVGTAYMRGDHYTLVLECQECGHQEAC